MNDNYITLTIGKKKNIALIAHDNKKADLIEWCEQNKDILTQHFLCGTGTTARMITDKTGLPVKGYNSGPLGGDQQIGAKIVEGRIDFVVFFSDPLTALKKSRIILYLIHQGTESIQKLWKKSFVTMCLRWFIFPASRPVWQEIWKFYRREDMK